jgi:malonate-semialdehyde dehydrogenase (acetylating)/methylmalonate-semialdehyde dehydrogenase
VAEQLKNLVGGVWTAPDGAEGHAVIDPADGRTAVAEVKYSTRQDVEAAVAAALEALPAWRGTPAVRRCRTLMRCKELLEDRLGRIAESVVRENGKLLSEAEGEVRRGLEVVEFASGMPSLAKGDFIEDISARVDGYIYREPVGVVAGACPFNFPFMIPMWMAPVAIACGNTFVLKPSEKCPVSATLTAELLLEAGLPPGVFNVVQGARETFEALITHAGVDAVSFVGSSPSAQNVWNKAAAHHKRVQALGGAKNYLVVMADAEPEETVKAVIHSAYGCAGERCMAGSVLVLVGAGEGFLDPVVEAARALKLGSGLDPQTGMGPVISAAHRERIEGYVELGLREGARLVLDGRGARAEGLPDGFFIGPTVFDDVAPGMRIAREEIFGPVLCVMRARDLGEAVDLANASPYGNGASVFTASGAAAREFRSRVQCGMVGINAGVPAPMAFFSFGGFKNSFFGDLRAHGPDSVEFYTRKKAVIERWPGLEGTGGVWGR